jgi:K(+)-stimulated pyrophosphate-energized sodium pump
LAGLLAGSIASGMMIALIMANAGGAWDNAKKYIEIEGAQGGVGTLAHKAWYVQYSGYIDTILLCLVVQRLTNPTCSTLFCSVVGDTVGDPFKDTSGPSLNILIKLMSLIALTIAPLIEGDDDWDKVSYGLIPLAALAIGALYVYRSS